MRRVWERFGIPTIASFVSPYKESRDFVRNITSNFVEVHVATSLSECERRDVKGLYQQARKGEISQFTGVDDPYEFPDHPELTIDTEPEDIDESTSRVLSYLFKQGFLAEANT